MPAHPTGLTLRLLAAAASLGAGVIHAAVVPGHWAEWLPSGLFFALLAAAQIGWAAAHVWRPGRTLAAIGVVVNLGALVVWGLSRTPAGLPFGPDAGERLVVGRADAISSVLAVLVVVALVLAVTSVLPERSRLATPLLVLAAVTIAAVSVSGVSSAVEHDHAAHGDDGAHHHDDGGHEGEGHGESPAPTAPTAPASETPSPAEETTGHSHDDGHDTGGHAH